MRGTRDTLLLSLLFLGSFYACYAHDFNLIPDYPYYPVTPANNWGPYMKYPIFNESSACWKSDGYYRCETYEDCIDGNCVCNGDRKCSGHGQCGTDGDCHCEDDWWGEACESAVPSGWNCPNRQYGHRDGCQCECNLPDPDCDDNNKWEADNCTDWQVCSNGTCACRPEVWCEGHGTCNYTGHCYCDDGYYGDHCEKKVPSDWTCNVWTYDQDSICDCDCGAYDPDCDLPNTGNSVNPPFCASYEFCNATGHCECDGARRCNGEGTCGEDGRCSCNDDKWGLFCEEDVPTEWTSCPNAQYGKDDLCQCDCGAHDPDCDEENYFPPANKPSYIYCVDGHGYCDGTIQCTGHGSCTADGTCDCEHGYIGANCESKVPVNWVCDPYWYDRDGICQCDCGAPDPDCSANQFGAKGCASYEKCMNGVCTCDGVSRCSGHGTCGTDGVCDCDDGYANLDCSRAADGAWTCDRSKWGDGTCDCNCGYHDPDCDELNHRRASPDCSSWAACEDAACVCNPQLKCNGHGTCDSAGECTCWEEYYGDACENKVPETWFMNKTWFARNSRCDCGGAVDPDCSGNNVLGAHGCEDWERCVDGYCTCDDDELCNDHGKCNSKKKDYVNTARIQPYTSNAYCDCDAGWSGDRCQTQIPEGWTCLDPQYGQNAVCDCNCGAVDPDCNDSNKYYAPQCQDDELCTTGNCTSIFLYERDMKCKHYGDDKC